MYGCFQLHKRLKARRRASRPVQYRDNENWEPPSPARIAEAARYIFNHFINVINDNSLTLCQGSSQVVCFGTFVRYM